MPQNISWDLNTVRAVLGLVISGDGGVEPFSSAEATALHRAVPDGVFTIGGAAVVMDQPTAMALEAYGDARTPQYRSAFIVPGAIAAAPWVPWAIGGVVVLVLGGAAYAATRR